MDEVLAHSAALEAELASKERSLEQAGLLGQQLLARVAQCEAQRDALRAQLEEQCRREEEVEQERRRRAGDVEQDKFSQLHDRLKAALEGQESFKAELKEGMFFLIPLFWCWVNALIGQKKM